MRDADFGMRGYDAWRLSGPPESYDERSECAQHNCDQYGHKPGCPDYTEDDSEPLDAR